jgi:hypothetical protein
MGYTHYWNYVPSRIKDTEVLRKKFKRASKQIKKFAEFVSNEKLDMFNSDITHKPFKLCGGLGEGTPVFNETEIWFNGDGTESMNHETFRIYWSTDEKAFCKTAHKPYDLLVCFALLTFAEIFGKNVFSFSSDGDMEDEEWQLACEYYQDVTGKKPITESIN